MFYQFVRPGIDDAHGGGNNSLIRSAAMDVIRHEKELSVGSQGCGNWLTVDMDASEFFVAFKVQHLDGIVEAITYVQVFAVRTNNRGHRSMAGREGCSDLTCGREHN